MFLPRLMCRLLQVSLSGYDARQRLTAAIHTLHAESDGVYGSPKIWPILQNQGEGCGKHRIARLMREESLCGIPSRKQWKGRKSGDRPGG